MSSIQEIEESELVYLSPLTLKDVKAQITKGKFGNYQSGYIVVFTLDNGSTDVSIIAKRGNKWFPKMHAARVMNPSLKKFAFTFNPLTNEIEVNGVIA